MKGSKNDDWIDPKLKGTEQSPSGSLSDNNDMSQGTISDTESVDVRLALDRQRIRHRRWLFYGTGFVVLALYALFGIILFYKPDSLLLLVKETPYAITLEILCGVTPTTLLIFLILAIFRSPKKHNQWDNLDGKEVFEVISKFASIAKLFK